MNDVIIALKINTLENSLTRDLIVGKAIPITETITHVFNKDGVIVQKLEVVDGERTPAITSHCFDFVNGEPEFATVAVLSIDGSGNQTWARELTQEGVL